MCRRRVLEATITHDSSELALVEAEFHDKQRGKSEGNDADSGEGVAKVAMESGTGGGVLAARKFA